MKLLEFLESVNLMEAAIDRYLKSVEPLIQTMATIDEANTKPLGDWLRAEVQWAFRVFGGNDDKIQWYMRFAKAQVLWRLRAVAVAAAERDPNNAPLVQQTERMYNKVAGQMSNKMGIDRDSVWSVAGSVTAGNFHSQMEHFMSLGLPGIENTVFGWHKPEDIIAVWTPIERAWQENASQIVDPAYDEDDEITVEVIKQYPGGAQWVDLKRPYCTTYGNAHGTCGNSASWTEHDTSLIYRTPEKNETSGEMWWKPRLFFVLDQRHGLLGETKGRVNQKPSAKYHDVIIDLLRDPRVKGIKGGGHNPHDNFFMDDLPEDIMEKLIEEKPGLATPEYDYKKRGMTQELLTRIDAMIDSINITVPEYDKDNRTFNIDMDSTDPNETLGEIGGDHGKWVASVLTGDNYDDNDYHSGDSYLRKDILNGISSNDLKALGEYLMEEYPDEIEEWKEAEDEDFSVTSVDDILSFVVKFDIDSVTTALDRAEETGHRYGAENEMHETAKSYMEDLPNKHELNLSIPYEWDKPVHLQMDEDSMIDVVTNHLDQLEYASEWMEFFEIKEMDGPYHGYSGYDEKAAIGEFPDRLSEEGIDV